jgi:hypothetical protein
MLTATTAVTAYLQITKPYTGRWLTAKLYVPSTSKENEPLSPQVTIENLGDEEAPDVYADVTFYDGNTSVGKVQTSRMPIAARGTGTVSALWDNRLTPGVYRADAVVYGGQNNVTADADFFVGTLDVELLNITKVLQVGHVNPLVFTLQNRWNNALRGVRAVFMVGPNVTDGWRTAGPEFTLYPWEPVTQEYYMNIPPVIKPGKYPGVLELTFAGGTKKFALEFDIIPDGSAVIESPAKVSGITNVVRLSFILLLVIIAIIYYRQRRKERMK